jgi:[acyl-carrier-protein] S-malonyltransferase
MSNIAVIFPNEGSQYVGMGKEFYDRTVNVRDFYDVVEKKLDIKIASISFLGPKEEMQPTPIAHLLTLLADVSFYDPFVQNRRKANLMMGIGIGEIAALVVAECIPFSIACQFVYKRAQIIDEFAKKKGGINVLLSGITLDKLESLLNPATGPIVITQFLAPDTFVLWGPATSLNPLMDRYKNVRTVKSTVLGPRGPLFTAQAVELESQFDVLLTECLGETRLFPPKIATHRMLDGEQINSPTDVRDLIVKQYSQPVDWARAVRLVIDRGFRTWVEVGPKTIYGDFIRKIDKNNRVCNVENMKSLSIAVQVTSS